jgi:hypothetical protein
MLPCIKALQFILMSSLPAVTPTSVSVIANVLLLVIIVAMSVEYRRCNASLKATASNPGAKLGMAVGSVFGNLHSKLYDNRVKGFSPGSTMGARTVEGGYMNENLPTSRVLQGGYMDETLPTSRVMQGASLDAAYAGAYRPSTMKKPLGGSSTMTTSLSQAYGGSYN